MPGAQQPDPAAARPASSLSTPYRFILTLLTGLLACAGSGCEGPLGSRRRLPPISDRLLAAYPDLEKGRFMVVADFETADQQSMFAAVGGPQVPQPRMTTKRARNQTGAGSLELSFDAQTAAIVAGSDPGARWSLPRDWSGYHMLMMSLHAPGPLGTLRITVRGSEPSRVFVQERVPLREGWNLIHLDCGELADALDLRDIRRLEWSVTGLEQPLVLYLDDLILVDNTKSLCGSPEAEAGDLYVVHQGRRIRVGAVGRFELVLHRGLVAAWYDLGADPARASNLVASAALGPMPILLPAAEVDRVGFDPVDQWGVLGPTPTVRQAVVEASAFRAVIAADWTWGGSPGQSEPAETGPRLSWRYTVYPSGRMFVWVSAPTETASWRTDNLGLAVFCDGRKAFAPPTAFAQPDAAFGLLSRKLPRCADLVVVPAHRGADDEVRPIHAANDPRVGLIHLPGSVDRPHQRWAQLLVFWPPDLDTELAARPVAADYQSPRPPAVEWGKLIQTDPGDLDNDGYNESEGVFVLAPQENSLRATLNPDSRLRFDPILKLLDTARKEVWVYANGRIVRDVGRTTGGDVLIRIGQTIDQPVLVEVHCQDRADGQAAPEGNRAHGT